MTVPFARPWEERLQEFKDYQARVRAQCLCKKAIKSRILEAAASGPHPFRPMDRTQTAHEYILSLGDDE